MVDPDEFIITRRRKKYKFARFANSPLCFEYDEWRRRPVDVVEVGAGNGLFSVELAARHPERSYVAIDVKGDRLQKGAYEAEARGMTNVTFLRARADQLEELLTERSLRELWLTFPDPYPKKGSAGRRLTHPTFLRLYRRVLASDGALCLKHDSRDFFLWSLEQVVGQGWGIRELSFDLHESSLDDDYKVITSYEERWLQEGSLTNFVRATPPEHDS